MKLSEECYPKLFLFSFFIFSGLFFVPTFADTMIIEIPTGMATSNCGDTYSCPYPNPITGRVGDAFTFVHLDPTASVPYAIGNLCEPSEHPLDCASATVGSFSAIIDYGERVPIFLDRAGVYPYTISGAPRAYGHIIVEEGTWPPTSPPFTIENIFLEDENGDGVYLVGESILLRTDVTNRKTDESFIAVFEAGIGGLVDSRSWITGTMSNIADLNTITAASSFVPTRAGVYDVLVYLMEDRERGRVMVLGTTSFEVFEGPVIDPPVLCPYDARTLAVDRFEIPFVYDGGTIRSISFDELGLTLVIEADTPCDATLRIEIPTGLIAPDFIILTDGEESTYEVLFGPGFSTTVVVRPGIGSEIIEIIGNPPIPPPTPDYTVRIPVGSNVPGCEATSECYIPSGLVISPGETVEWINEDSAVHTVTSGDPDAGPDGIFDSGLMGPGSSFFYTPDFGEYPYFCMVHPWMIGFLLAGPVVDDLVVTIDDISLEVDGSPTTSIRQGQSGIVRFTIDSNLDFSGTAYVSIVDSSGRAIGTNFFSSRFASGPNDIGLSIFIPPYASLGPATIFFSVLDAPLPDGFPVAPGVEFPITILEGETGYGGYDEGYEAGYD